MQTLGLVDKFLDFNATIRGHRSSQLSQIKETVRTSHGVNLTKEKIEFFNYLLPDTYELYEDEDDTYLALPPGIFNQTTRRKAVDHALSEFESKGAEGWSLYREAMARKLPKHSASHQAASISPLEEESPESDLPPVPTMSELLNPQTKEQYK